MSDDGSHELGRRTFLKATGAAGAAAAVGTTNVVAGRDPERDREDEIILGLYDSASLQTAEVEIQDTLPQGSEVTHRNDSLGFLTVGTPESASQQAKDRLQRQLEGRSDVKYTEENGFMYTMSAEPSDPRFDEQYAPQQVNAPEAWEKTLGNNNATVGVIDNGAEWDHPNLEDRFGSEECDPPGIDFAGGGFPFPFDAETADAPCVNP